MWLWSLVPISAWYPLWAPGFWDFTSTLGQLFAPHPRHHQGEQLCPKPSPQTLSQIQMRSKPSGDFETNSWSYAKCDFAFQLHFDHHHHQYTSNNIWLQPTKKICKIQKLISFGHYDKHLVGREELEAHAEFWFGPGQALATPAVPEHHLTPLPVSPPPPPPPPPPPRPAEEKSSHA